VFFRHSVYGQVIKNNGF